MDSRYFWEITTVTKRVHPPAILSLSTQRHPTRCDGSFLIPDSLLSRKRLATWPSITFSVDPAASSSKPSIARRLRCI